MASSTFGFLVCFLTLFSLLFASESQVVTPRAPFRPGALLLPVLKDNQTSLHIVRIQKRTPLKSIPFLLDLNGKLLSVDCEQGYLSSTYNAPFCHSTQCSRAGPHNCLKCSSPAKPGCHNNSCAVIATNPLTRRNAVAELAQDILAIQTTTTRGRPGALAVIRRFLFACVQSSFLQGPSFPRNVQGIAGFGHDPIALPLQLASHFGFPPRFALCLSSVSNQNGVIVLGNTSDYQFIDSSRGLNHTPLTIGQQGEYFIMVKSISINRKPLHFNTSLISRTRSFGGAMISTTNPYTLLQHSIFQTFVDFFTNEISAAGASGADPIPPFSRCFRNLTQTPRGAPVIEFVMQNRNITWSIYGQNSMVEAKPGVWCLAFVDGGLKPRSSSNIVIGAHQLEDTVVEFDLARSTVGFSTFLPFSRASCAHFNFSSTP